MNPLQLLIDWSEVWALVIPMLILAKKRKQPKHLSPIILYVFIAFFINFYADLISIHIFPISFSKYFHENTYLYNIHTIVRFGCFSAFFILLKQPFLKTLKILAPIIFLLFTIIYFNFEKFANPDHISADFLATEAFVLLIYCLIYYLYKLKTENEKSLSGADFYVVTGLSVYVVVNFFVFLFYVPMIVSDRGLADNMWNIHNVGFIILCIFLAKAFNEPYAD